MGQLPVQHPLELRGGQTDTGSEWFEHYKVEERVTDISNNVEPCRLVNPQNYYHWPLDSICTDTCQQSIPLSPILKNKWSPSFWLNSLKGEKINDVSCLLFLRTYCSKPLYQCACILIAMYLYAVAMWHFNTYSSPDIYSGNHEQLVCRSSHYRHNKRMHCRCRQKILNILSAWACDYFISIDKGGVWRLDSYLLHKSCEGTIRYRQDPLGLCPTNWSFTPNSLHGNQSGCRGNCLLTVSPSAWCESGGCLGDKLRE